MPYKDSEKQRIAQRESTVRNSEIRRIRQKNARRDTRLWVKSLKDGIPCTDCGQSFHHSAMHWDHLPGTNKINSIQRLVLSLNRKIILDEIAKCELVCANCHSVRTYSRWVAEHPEE